jgi:uncharacterized membrane protein YfcA
MFFDILYLSVLGLISGIFSGVTGMISTGLILAMLSLINVMSNYESAMGTVLYVALFPITILSTLQYFQKNKINFLYGNILLATTIIGAYLGTKFILNTTTLSMKTLKYISAGECFIMSIIFLFGAYNSK